MRRRTFLLAGLGATGALVFGWSLVPPRQRLRTGHLPELPSGTVPLNGWLAIAPDSSVTIIAPKAEMGQGIHTALATLVAEELDCDWSQVRVTHSGVDTIYNNIAAIVDGLPFHEDLNGEPLVRGVRWLTAKTMREVGVMMTGGSSSVRDVWEVARQAGATARASLLAAAAQRTGVPATACRTERGVVICGDRTLPYGELLQEAAAQRVNSATLKPAQAWTIIGRDRGRLDADAKSTGAPMFGLDVRVDGMRYAAVNMAPTIGGTVAGFDRTAAMQQPGVRAVVSLEGSSFGDAPGVAIIADSWWQAKQALRALNVQWNTGPHAALDSAQIMRTLREAAQHDEGLPLRSVGEAKEAIAKGPRVLDVTYDAPYLAHATMEPMNAVVRVNANGAELWTGTQVPGFGRSAAAKVLGLDDDQITLHQTVLGGGFGRRLEVDYVAQAAAIAKALPGTAVQTIWSREDDMRHDFYRPAAVTRWRAALDAKGALTGVVSHSAAQAPFKSLSRRLGLSLTSYGPDKTIAEGTFDQPYEFPAIHASSTEVTLPVPVGSWRSVGYSHQGFFLESFVDELAHEAKQDPLRYRQALLKKHPRARAALDTVAQESDWYTPLGPASDGQPRARGVALVRSFSTVVAMVAEVSLSPTGTIRVHRVITAVDVGVAVNPAGVRQQVESAVVYGLSAALHGAVLIEAGRVVPGNFHEYRPLRMSECPEIVTLIVPSSEVPSGVGEPALPAIAPAVGNALFALTGNRLRSLPLRAATSAAPGAGA